MLFLLQFYVFCSVCLQPKQLYQGQNCFLLVKYIGLFLALLFLCILESIMIGYYCEM